MDLESFSCFIKSLLSALWLVDDSAAVSLRYVLTRDRMTTFMCFLVSSSVVLLAVFLVISWLIHVHSKTSAHPKPWTAQDVMTPCSSHSCLTDPNVLYCGKPFGSGVQFSILLLPFSAAAFPLLPCGWGCLASTSFWSCCFPLPPLDGAGSQKIKNTGLKGGVEKKHYHPKDEEAKQHTQRIERG